MDDSKTSKTVWPNVMRLARKSKAKIVSFTVDASVADVGAEKGERYLNRNALVTRDQPKLIPKSGLKHSWRIVLQPPACDLISSGEPDPWEVTCIVQEPVHCP